MGNKVGTPCVCIPIKRMKRKETRVAANFPSISDLSLENFLDAIEEQTPIHLDVPSFLCQICFESKPLNQSFDLEGCTHFYCTRCVAQYIVAKLKDNVFNVVCPEPTCSGILNPNHCKSILPSNVFEWWERVLSESAIPENVKFYCPFSDCSALLINNNDDGKSRMLGSDCPHCKRSICVKCQAPWHTELSCEKFQKKNNKSNDLMLDLAKRRKWKQCPNCKRYVEKTDGCNDITCRSVSFFFVPSYI
ncbi:E3 ubiquitin-protein ligase RSL1-like [Arachis hypogaea]|uniref:RBR-type E3 ubiquitin transferase n=1 Tax=Arachis hypogaea TaxID=3818 RepID=A0A445DVW5_ARAHY|nr:E3 ubiquitin-protein ligase RNF144B-like [Arachis hypogaea]RYR67313.1 hypothetical protein Ahy_A03g013639 [Arachis hypogaea]